PPGHEGFLHYHDTQDELYFVHRGRVTYAVLTETGYAKYRDVRTTHLADVEALFGSRFTEEERATLSGLLLQLLEPGEDETPPCATGAG
ncbi:MAG: hypothetical protein ACXVZ4_14450, partial [Gaiellaceae bacterium]